MNRRHFLSFIGLAPVTAALSAMALPRPEKPPDIQSTADAFFKNLVFDPFAPSTRVGDFLWRSDNSDERLAPR